MVCLRRDAATARSRSRSQCADALMRVGHGVWPMAGSCTILPIARLAFADVIWLGVELASGVRERWSI